MKRIALAADHGGYELKEVVKQMLDDRAIPYLDFGTNSDESCDYPDYAELAARSVSEGNSEGGIFCCGSAAGMVIVANKFPGVRAVACHNEWAARMSRLHNDANVLALGGRVVSLEEAERIVAIWLETEFEGGRHSRRLDKISDIEDAFQPTS
ncbi:MAG: ribose 5-phosphate isomerase B [Nitrospinae bacterium]|nr:ribose 5-phosphate isomerase B [Nitrospinota bacterium]